MQKLRHEFELEKKSLEAAHADKLGELERVKNEFHEIPWVASRPPAFPPDVLLSFGLAQMHVSPIKACFRGPCLT